MNAIGHFVGRKRLPDLLDNRFVRWNLCEGQSQRGTAQAIEMFGEFEDAALIKPKAFPNGVAALYGRVEGAHAGVVAMDQIPVYVDDQVLVLFVESLKHA